MFPGFAFSKATQHARSRIVCSVGILLGTCTLFTGCGSDVFQKISASPQIACSALPQALVPGQSASITAVATGMSGSSFHYSFQASSGTLTSNGSFAQWTPADTSGSSTVTCQATNNLGQTASATTSIAVETSAVATSVALNVPPGPFYVGGSVSLAAVVTSVSQAPTGNVTFYDGAAAIATVAVAPTGIASTTIANLSQGTHSLSANYSGNSTLSSSVSPSVSLVVSPTSSSPGSSPPTVNCSASPSAVIQGGQSLISASASSASGSPLQLHFSASAGTLNVSGSSAMLSTASVPPGSITITCQATDDFNQSATATSVVNVIAAQSPDTMMLLASPSPAIAGQPVTLTALLSATSGTPSGSVSFMDGGTVIGTAPISSGAATLVTSPLAQGTHALTATYPGNSLTTGNSASLSLVVSPALGTTVTTLTALPDSAVAGTPVTLISTVAATSGSVSGTVTFMDGNSLLGTSSVVTTTGQAQLSISTLNQGTHSITAVFSGSSSMAASTSTPVPVVITPRPAPPTISCSAAPSSINAGGATTITASTASSSGQPLAILFSSSAGTLVTSGSSAVFNSAGVPPGTVAVTCKATDALGQTSSAIASVVINPVLLATTTVLAATPATVIAGNAVVLTASVSATSPVSSGTVTFSNAGTTLGTSSVTTTGQAQLSISTLNQGTHSITAVFSGSSSLAVSASTPVPVVITPRPAPPTISCSAAPSSINTGSTTTITASAASSSGQPLAILFSSSAGTLVTSGSSAVFSSTGVPPGTVAVTCKATDALGQTSSAIASVVINPVLLATTTVLTATPATIIAGNAVVLTASVSATSPVSSGTVTFMDGNSLLGTSSVTTTGQAQLSVSTLNQGTHSITAVFAGSSSLAASTSSPVSVVVSASAPPTITCSVAPSSVNPGDQAYITAVASSAAGRTTTVSFSTSGGNLSVTGSSATLNTTGMTSGAVEITCKATDDLGQTGSATTSLWINSGQGEQALTAYNFTDSVGVNIHLHFTNTPEVMDFPDFLTSIIALGVHHYRNGIDPYAVPFEYASAETLASAGIKADWLISSADAPQNINAIYANAPNSIEAFEGPNEDNTDAGPVLANFMSMLYSTVKGNPNTATVPVYAPTLTELPLIGLQGSLAAYDNYANMHDYYYPRNPETASYGGSFFGCGGYGSMAFNICIAQLTSPGTPVISTETGYISGTQSDEVLGRYITRTLFMHLGMNVMRTYLYEFVDDVDSPGFGLVHSDFTPKPAYTAIKNLISLFNDQSFATPGKFDYTLTGQTNNVQHVLFQKSDGTYMMAIWLGVQSADEVSPYETYSIPPQTVSIATETPVGNVTVYTLDDEGNMTNSPGDTVTSTTSLAVTDRITIVTFSPSSN